MTIEQLEVPNKKTAEDLVQAEAMLTALQVLDRWLPPVPYAPIEEVETVGAPVQPLPPAGPSPAKLRAPLPQKEVKKTSPPILLEAELDPESISIENWWRYAKCQNENPDYFFVVGAEQNKVKRFCSDCPAVRFCLSEALDNGYEWGVWGGKTERERRAMLKNKPNASFISIFVG